MRRTLCALLLLLAPAIADATPTIAITSPAGQAITNSRTVRGTVTGAAPVTVTVNGVSATVANGNFTATSVPLVEGANTITATATDTDTSVSDSVDMTYDVTNPAVTISDPNDGLITPFRSVVVSGTATDVNGIAAFFVDGVQKTLGGAGVYSERVALTPGAKVIRVFASDVAGNSAFADITVTWQIVCQDPNYPATAPDGPQFYAVTRNDDLADPIPDDDVCDVRPDLRPDPDPNDPNAPVPFVPPAGRCTLRAAIQTANHHPGPDRIGLGNRVITLRRTGAGDDGAASGDLDITDDLRIVGNSRDSSIIDGSKLGDRVFDVAPGVKLQLLRLTVTGGRTPKPAAALGDPNDTGAGGCVRSRGTLETNNAAILNCKSDGSGGAISLEGGSAAMTCSIVARGQAKTDGGGIAFDAAPLSLRNSTLSLNSAGRRGGALSGIGDDPTLRNVTLSHNKAKLAGGALDLGDGADATLNNCTFTNNSAKVGAAISTTGTGSVAISNSILGDASKLACDPNAAVVSLGGNFDRGDSCKLSHATDQPNVDPRLDKLATNVGPPTHALRNDSPAIDAGGGETACEPLDARDVERGDWPGNGTGSSGPGAAASPPYCDSGAFELRTPN